MERFVESVSRSRLLYLRISSSHYGSSVVILGARINILFFRTNLTIVLSNAEYYIRGRRGLTIVERVVDMNKKRVELIT